MREGQFVTTVYDDKIYVAQVKEAEPGRAHVKLSFMRPHGMSKCNWPSKPDILAVPRCDILTCVQPPGPISSTSRFHTLTIEDQEKSSNEFKLWKTNMN